MADRDALLAALRAADAAGDAPAATAIARRLAGANQAPAGAANAGGAVPVPTQGAATPSEGVLSPDGSSSVWDRMRYGLAGAGIQAYLGLKQTLGHTLTPEEQSVLQQSQADVGNSGAAGKIANAAGNIGLGVAGSMAVPGVAVAKIPRLLKMALGGAATAGVTTPVDSTDPDAVLAEKEKQAAIAGAAGPAMGGVLKGAKAAATGIFDASPDAVKLFAQGINPTLRQAADSSVGKFIGGLTSGFANSKDRQEQEALDLLTKQISAGQVSAPGATVGQRLGMLGSNMDAAYTGVLGGKKFPMNNAIRDEMSQQADNLGQSGGRFMSQVQDAREPLDNIIGTDRNTTRMGIDKLQQNYQQPLQNAINDANDPMVKSALVNAKNVLIAKSRNAPLSADEQSALKDIDSRYFDLMRLQEAGNINETGVDINKLSKAYQSGPGMDVMGASNTTNDNVIGPAARVIGNTPQQEASRTAMNMVRRISGPAVIAAGAGAAGAAGPLALAAAPLYALSALGQTARGAKYLTGQYGPQQALESALTSPQTGDVGVANLLRALRDGSTNIGAAYAAQQ